MFFNNSLWHFVLNFGRHNSCFELRIISKCIPFLYYFETNILLLHLKNQIYEFIVFFSLQAVVSTLLSYRVCPWADIINGANLNTNSLGIF
jgi:hypothetical protein